jgi:multiple sugar transport system ATP-binding protein
MASLTINDLHKSFGSVEVLKGINLHIEDGGFLVLVGPSGCGKSTLLNTIAGLEEITSGEIQIGDSSVQGLHPSKRNIAMVFQSYALYPNMTVSQNIGFGMEMKGIEKTAREESIKKVAETLQITELLDRKPGQLSGGQRQRVAMGRAIVREPQVFLFDEPLSNLDAKLRIDMRTEIKRLHQRLGSTIIYVTHDQIEAMTLATKIAVLKDGCIQQFDTPYEIYNNPNNMFVANFMGAPAMNLIEGNISKSDTFAVVELGQKQIIARLNGNSQVSAGDTVKLTFDLSQAVFFDRQSEERIR